MIGQRLRIRLKAYDHRVLDASTATVVATARGTGSEVAGPVPLPTTRSLICVLRSPHGDKKAREQFELKTHKRLVDIIEPTKATIAALGKLELPAGIDVEIEAYEQ